MILNPGDIFIFLNEDRTIAESSDPIMICGKGPELEGGPSHYIYWMKAKWEGVLPDNHIIMMLELEQITQLSGPEALAFKLKFSDGHGYG